MPPARSRLRGLFLVRVLGLHLTIPFGLAAGVALNLVTGGQLSIPTIRLPVEIQQVVAPTLSLAVGWMLVDEWPRIVRPRPRVAIRDPLLRWTATQVVCVTSVAVAVAGAKSYDAVALASLMCSLAALMSVVVRQAWWIPPLLVGYLVLRVNGLIDPHDPVAHDTLLPALVGLVSVFTYVGVALGRSLAPSGRRRE